LLRDKQRFEVQALRQGLVDLFVYLKQSCMALNMDLEEEYKKKMKTFEGEIPQKATKKSP